MPRTASAASWASMIAMTWPCSMWNRPQSNGSGPALLALAAQAPPRIEGRPVYLVGYPVRDARRGEPEPVARIFRDVYNVKRVQPGTLRGVLQFRDIRPAPARLRAMLGPRRAKCLLDLETHPRSSACTSAGRYLDMGTAVPLWMLRDDPLLRQAGVTFTEATTQERAGAHPAGRTPGPEPLLVRGPGRDFDSCTSGRLA